MSNVFDRVTEIVKKSGLKGGLTEEQISPLLRPSETIIVNFPVKTQNGNEVFKGIRVRYNDNRGPTKGGMRFHQHVDENEAYALAFYMMLKCSLTRLPFGGGKGGLIFNPKKYEDEDIELISKEFFKKLANFVGVERDIAAPDVNTNAKVMEWFLDAYNEVNNGDFPAIVTGKPIERGGSVGRLDATGRGALLVLNHFVTEGHVFDHSDKSQIKIAIHGFGNGGRHFARLACKEGYKIIAVSDSSGTIHNKEGLDIEKLINHKNEKKKVTGFEGGEDIEEIFSLECDVIVPAAIGGAITEDNAEDIKAKLILEIANLATHPKGDEILKDNDVKVIPDILSNAGGVIVSFFEWHQNMKGVKWDEEKIHKELEKIITKAAIEVINHADENEMTYRESAFVIALNNVIDPSDVIKYD